MNHAKTCQPGTGRPAATLCDNSGRTGSSRERGRRDDRRDRADLLRRGDGASRRPDCAARAERFRCGVQRTVRRVR